MYHRDCLKTPVPPILHLTREIRDAPQVVFCERFAIRCLALPDDGAAWLALREVAFRGTQPRPGPWSAEDARRELAPAESSGFTRTWVLEPSGMEEMAERTHRCGKNLAGSVTLKIRGSGQQRSARVHWLLVHPRFQRRGLATRLMATLENACVQAGIRQISLETHRNWTAAVAFYRRLGYA